MVDWSVVLNEKLMLVRVEVEVDFAVEVEVSVDSRCFGGNGSCFLG